MARKDLEKETERPRYYSQFWLDVAAGRRVIGAGKGSQDTDEAESSDVEPMPETNVKSGKGVRDVAPPPFVEAEPAASREPSQPLRLSGTESLADLAAAAGLVDIEPVDEETLDQESEEVLEDDLEPLPSAGEEYETEPEEEPYSYSELYDEEEEEEEEEESDDWPPSRRGKKQHKKPDKPRRRERGREF